MVLRASGRVHAELRASKVTTSKDAAQEVIALAVPVVPGACRVGPAGGDPARAATPATAQVAEEVATVVPTSSVASTAVLPAIEARPLLTTAVEAIPALGAPNAVALLLVAKLAKHVVVDGAWRPVPRGGPQAVASTVVLVVGEDVAASRAGTAWREPGGSTCTSS